VIRLTEIASYLGPSLYGRTPVMRANLALESPDERFVGAPSETVIQALSDIAPGLSERLASPDAAGGECPIWAGKWLDTVRLTLATAVEILYGTGADPLHADVVEDTWGTHIVYEHENPGVYAGALQIAVGLVNGFVLAPVKPATIDQLVAEARQALEVFSKQAREVNWYLDMRGIIRDARAQDIPVQVLMHNVIMLGHGKNRRMMMSTSTDAMSYFSYFVSCDKSLSIELLRQHGLPVPVQRAVNSPDEARAAAQSLGYPVVLKPAIGGKGQGVTADVRNEAALNRAFERAKGYGNAVIVETFLQGIPHRINVIGDEIVWVASMHGAAVTGDGEKTIAELVEIENRDPLRAPKSGVHRQIELDEEILDTMLNDGNTPESIPPAGERVRLSSTGNTSRGGHWEPVLDVHPDVAEAVLLAHRVLGLDISGVDFILPDASKSWKGTGGGICEVNPMPGMWGIPDVTDRVFEFLFPPGKTPHIPVAGILGSETGSRAATMLSAVMQGAGRTTGLACERGCRVNDSVINEGDASGARYALQIQRDPRIDSAVLQTSTAQVLAEGFGFASCDVAAITTALSETGDVEKLLAELTKGSIVLDADDPRCAELMSFEKTPRVCLVSQDASNETVTRHIQSGGDVVRLEPDGDDSWIVSSAKSESKKIVRTQDLTPEDDDQIRAALFAVAMGMALGVTTENCQTALTGTPAS